eukprot:7763138-Lingulodinium_polyedra.AAC.1
MPSATQDTHAADSVQRVTEIEAASRSRSEGEYEVRLVAWGQQCEKAMQDPVEEYIFHHSFRRKALVQDDAPRGERRMHNLAPAHVF